jgi:biopolymer transport protein ExbD
MHIERAVRKTRPVPMTSLIDITFLFLFFFMLSTSFVRTESMELTLPHAAGTIVPGEKLLQVYVSEDGQMFAGRKPVEEEQLVQLLKEMLVQHPDLNILVLSGPKVTVQQLVTVMDRVYLAGAKNLSVASWKPADNEPGMGG